jgi:hypothetical protein
VLLHPILHPSIHPSTHASIHPSVIHCVNASSSFLLYIISFIHSGCFIDYNYIILQLYSVDCQPAVDACCHNNSRASIVVRCLLYLSKTRVDDVLCAVQ